jgi:hypothetical protein
VAKLFIRDETTGNRESIIWIKEINQNNAKANVLTIPGLLGVVKGRREHELK